MSHREIEVTRLEATRGPHFTTDESCHAYESVMSHRGRERPWVSPRVRSYMISQYDYGVATNSRLLKIIGLFLQKSPTKENILHGVSPRVRSYMTSLYDYVILWGGYD